METVSINGLILIIAVCAITFLIGRLTSKGRKDNVRLEKDLEQSKKELGDYRSQVTSHFQETAQRVNILTENYRSVYEHLAQGAQTLCNQGDAPQLMNELNRNPMLGGETIESPEVEQEVVAAETDADHDSGPEAEVEPSDENREAMMDAADQNEQADEETDQGADATEQAKTDEQGSDEGNDAASDQLADEHVDEKPIIAAAELIESDQQPATEKVPA